VRTRGVWGENPVFPLNVYSKHKEVTMVADASPEFFMMQIRLLYLPRILLRLHLHLHLRGTILVQLGILGRGILYFVWRLFDTIAITAMTAVSGINQEGQLESE
jgi:hypothetical protein